MPIPISLLFQYQYTKIFVNALNRFNDLELKKGNISFKQHIQQKMDNDIALTKIVNSALAKK